MRGRVGSRIKTSEWSRADSFPTVHLKMLFCLLFYVYQVLITPHWKRPLQIQQIYKELPLYSKGIFWIWSSVENNDSRLVALAWKYITLPIVSYGVKHHNAQLCCYRIRKDPRSTGLWLSQLPCEEKKTRHKDTHKTIKKPVILSSSNLYLEAGKKPPIEQH